MILVGGLACARYAPAVLSGPFRHWLRWGALIALASGLYNLLIKAGLPSGYHMWFGIKMLLMLHIVTTAVLATKAAMEERKRSRLATGAMIAGFAAILISAYLRTLSSAL